MNQKQAVMIVIEKEGKFLLGKRADWKPKAPGYWCPISGHIEEGESEEAAVVREAWEEVGLMVKPYRRLGSIDTHDGTTKLHWWQAKIMEGEAFIKNRENSELGWFTPEELGNLRPTFKEDIAMVLKVLK
jgi:8-oxo-dGTP pyrophosphatase MutT (NUDIX family)